MQRTIVILALALGACSTAPKDTANPEPAPTTAAPTESKPAPAKVDPIPKGFYTLTPMVTVKGADAAVDFYVKAFGAQKLFAVPGPDGKTMHAEIKLGDSIVMIDEEMAEGPKAPATLGGSPATLLIYVANADEAFATAQAAGATVDLPLADQFWGDRYGQLLDPFGHRWAVATHIEDLTPEQMSQRGALLAPPPKAKKGKKAAKASAEPAWKKVVGTPTKTPVPPGYHTVTPSFVAADAAKLIDFYKAAFGATERDRVPDGSGKLMHAEVVIGDSILMFSDENPAQGSKSALTLGGSPVTLMMYGTDVDAAFARATTAGAKAVVPVTDMFWGDRYGAVLDISGFHWGLATHKEDVTPEQMSERMKAQTGAPAKPAN